MGYTLQVGKGWYTYKDRKPTVDPEVVAIIAEHRRSTGLAQRSFTDEEIIRRCFLPLVNEGYKILEEGIALRVN